MDRKYNLIADNETLSLAGKLKPFFTEEKLIAMSNKGTYKRALKDMSDLTEVTFKKTGENLSVILPEAEVTFSEKAEKIMCNCKAKTVCRHIILAALIISENGAEEENSSPFLELDDLLSIESEDDVGDSLLPDMKYLSEVMEKTEIILKKGIINCTDSDIEALKRLSLKGANTVHREISKLLRVISEKISLMNNRSSAFSPLETALTLGRIYNLCKASERHEELLSTGNEYENNVNGHFFCTGYYPWVTESGYGGVTAAIFSEDGKERFSVSVTMPLIYKELDEKQITENVKKLAVKRCLWESDMCVSMLSGRNIIMYGGHSDKSGRLSLSTKTSAVMGEYFSEEELPCNAFVSERRSYDYFNSDKSEGFFLVRTEKILIHKNSAASGFLDFDILSDDGKIYSCSLKITEINKKAYNFIKASDEETLKGKILTLRKSGRFYLPVSALWGENVTNIFF